MCENVNVSRLKYIESKGKDSIKIGVSRYKNKLIRDQQLLHYLGNETYCRIRKMDPDLWIEFFSCTEVGKNQNEIDSIIYEFGFDSYSVKKQLIVALTTGKKSPLVKKIEFSSLPPHDTGSRLHINIFWILYIFILSFSIVLFLIYSGIISSLFNEKDGIFTGNSETPTCGMFSPTLNIFLLNFSNVSI